jgi:ATP-dependent DNA helicase PIF1
MDLCDNNKPFGGMTMVFGGDLRQILPVIPRASGEEIRSSIITKASFWDNVNVYRLTRNMRLDDVNLSPLERAERRSYAEFIREVGEGKIPEDANGNISIPEKYIHKGNLKSLLSWVYDGIEQQTGNGAWITERAILTPKNEEVHAINTAALEKLNGDAIELLSVDTNVNDGGQYYPVELLNSFKPSGMPLHTYYCTYYFAEKFRY